MCLDWISVSVRKYGLKTDHDGSFIYGCCPVEKNRMRIDFGSNSER